MSTARIRTADAMTGAWGLVLLGSLFLDWYTRPQGGVSAWGAFAVLDVLLGLLALLAILVPVVAAANEAPAWPVATLVLSTAFAFLTSLFLLYRLLDQPGPDGAVAVDAGAWLGSFALLGLFMAAAIALRDERAPGVAGPGEIPVMPAPPRDVPGSSPTQEPA
jgi:protein-S-isoprenylcysteine O-methyltransferase Ste14